ncbi:hypothetical protein HDU77_003059 [Chytriomyces hyalinus]|nr:hypothetical protein HDU77_003059 [Chytriomyces hyalinus]
MTVTSLNAAHEFEALSAQQARGYLKRIGRSFLRMDEVPSLDLLNQLVYAHATSVPFENIGPLFTKTELPLDPPQVFQLLVTEKRGGTCLQNNLLFLCAAKALGFKASSGVGRFAAFEKSIDKWIFNAVLHMIVFVELGNDTYLVDLGGTRFVEAIQVRVGATSEGPAGEAYRIQAADLTGPGNFMVWHRRAPWAAPADGIDPNSDPLQRFTPLFYFTLERGRPQDYEVMNFYVSHSPKHFLQRFLFLSIVSKSGAALQLVGKAFRRRETSETSALNCSVDVESFEQLDLIIQSDFGIQMSQEEKDAALRHYWPEAAK